MDYSQNIHAPRNSSNVRLRAHGYLKGLMRNRLRQHYPPPAPTHGSPAHAVDGPPRSAVDRDTTTVRRLI